MSKVIEGLLYSETHEWVKVEGDVAVIGVTDFAQSEMGDITYVDMPEADDEVSKDEEFGALESVKASLLNLSTRILMRTGSSRLKLAILLNLKALWMQLLIRQ